MLLKSLRDVYRLVRSYICTVVVALLFMYVIRVSQIFDHYVAIIMSSSINLSDKFEQIIDPVFQLFTFTDGFDLNAFLIIIVSLLQGVVITLMLYIQIFKRSEIEMLTVCEVPSVKKLNASEATNDARHSPKIGIGAGVSGASGALISFLGVGCVPCKTALISPLISLIFSAGGPVAFATTVIMDAVLLISILLSVFAISKMLYLLAEVYYPVEYKRAKEKAENNGKSAVDSSDKKDLSTRQNGSVSEKERNNHVK